MPTSTYADSLRKAKKEATSDHDLEAIKLAEEKMKELEEQLSISLDLISARNGVQEWKQIHDLKTRFMADLHKITSLTMKRAMDQSLSRRCRTRKGISMWALGRRCRFVLIFNRAVRR